MTENILAQGAELMITGMGAVFIFLTILVFATTAMSWFVQAFLAVEEPDLQPSHQPVASDEVNPDTVAAIKAAIAMHRSAKGRK